MTFPTKDISRNKFDLKFYCTKHPETVLTFSSDLSKVGANSGFEINAKIFIHPCADCRMEVENIKAAVSILLETKNL